MDELSILELQEKMGSGEMTARGFAEAYLERIVEIDRQGPAINAVIELNPEALAIAEALDEERRSGRLRGPMHGVPILIKDNIDTRDRMQTTAGSLALAGSIASRDAFIVGRLRAAGAVILGKTNLSEWANFRGKLSTSGWSSRGGLTRNPYALDRTACSSSSGSAAAVAANLCAAAVGTETDGSIICPAQTCGIVGLKPTLGLLSRSGIIPIAHSQDTAGPMARSVADLAILLGAMMGFDASDQAMRFGDAAPRDYLRFLDPEGLRGARLGVARALAGSNPRVLEVFESCLDVMKKAGAILIDPVELPEPRRLGKNELEVLHYEFKADLNAYLASLGSEAPLRTLTEIIEFNEDNRNRVMPFFGQEHMVIAEGKAGLASRPYRLALARNRRLARREGIDRCLKRHRLDAIVMPSGEPAWMIDLVNGDSSNSAVESTSLAAVAGYPHLTVPAGYLFGLPLGLSFFSTAWREPTLIKLAYAFEQATMLRRPPRFAAHADTDRPG